MSGAVLVAIAAAVGNLLQGWDNATIAGNRFFLSQLLCLFLCSKGSLLSLASRINSFILWVGHS